MGLSGSESVFWSLTVVLSRVERDWLGAMKTEERVVPQVCPYMWEVVSPVWAQLVKSPPALQETQVLSLGQEDPLKKGMAIHSSILAWRIPRTEEPGGLQSMGSQRVRAD